MADKPIIVCTVRGGQLIPLPNLFDEDLKALEGQTVALEVTGAKPAKMRSTIQNASLHKYFANISASLNNAGFDQRGILAHIGRGSPIPWSPESVKSLWKSVIRERKGKVSTKQMTTAEYDKDHMIFNNMISDVTGGAVSCPLPSRGSMSYE